VADISSTIK